MDQYETSSIPSGQFQADNKQSFHEEDVKSKSHTKEENIPDSDHNDHEVHIPSRLDHDERSGAQNGDIPNEDFSLKQDEASPKDKEDNFDFEKKLPEIPQDHQKLESDTSMKFSPAHFQDKAEQGRAVQETEQGKAVHETEQGKAVHETEQGKAVHETDQGKAVHETDQDKAVHETEQLRPEVKQEKYSDEDDEEVVEPEQEVSHRKPQEASPEAIPTKPEEISPPSQSHSLWSPAPIEEAKQETPSNKLPESVPVEEKSVSPSPVGHPESKSHHLEPAPSAERESPAEPSSALAEPPKTRSIRSTKSEGRSFLGRWFDLSRLNTYVVDLVHWRDPRKSGIVLGAILAILLSLSVVSVVSVISYSALAVLSGTLSFRLYKNVLQVVQKTQDGHPFKEYLEQDVTVTTEKVHEVADLTAAKMNAILVELRRLFLVEDLVDSVKFALALWALTYVGSMFNGLTLVILGVIGLFTFPKVYETHQEKIDQNVDLVKGKINEIVDKVQAVLPFGKKAKSQ